MMFRDEFLVRESWFILVFYPCKIFLQIIPFLRKVVKTFFLGAIIIFTFGLVYHCKQLYYLYLHQQALRWVHSKTNFGAKPYHAQTNKQKYPCHDLSQNWRCRGIFHRQSASLLYARLLGARQILKLPFNNHLCNSANINYYKRHKRQCWQLNCQRKHG